MLRCMAIDSNTDLLNLRHDFVSLHIFLVRDWTVNELEEACILHDSVKHLTFRLNTSF
jgi:hypothetical protein